MKYTKIATLSLLSAISTMVAVSTTHASEGHDDKTMVVFKTPWCGCCQTWAEAMKNAGYRVETKDLNNLSQIKKQAGVSKKLEACHTAVIGDERKYVLEGHVPLAAVEKLMSEKPEIRGIATPGMPMGSLGMGFDAKAQYKVFAFTGQSNSTPNVFYKAGNKK